MLCVCTWSQLLMVGVAFLATLKTGWSVADRTVPDSGSIIAGSLGDEDITIFCEVFNDGGNQQLTTWMRQFLNGTKDGITIDDPNFAFGGEPVPGFPGATFNTNLTILTLTEDLDRNTIFCGATGVDEEAANFTIRIYRPPALRVITMEIRVCEDRNDTVDLQAAGAAEAFPFPQEFNWTRGGVAVDNTTDGGRVTYGYPSVIFDPFNRDEFGQYVLSAANYKTNGSLIGSDTGSFTLDVQYGPEFDEGDSSLAVRVEGNITLVCARNVDSNPPATVEWRDPAGIVVSHGGRYTLNNGPAVVSLTITGVIADDNGGWSSTVSVAGSCNNVEERSIMLTVVVTPSQPTNVDIDQPGITATSVRFCWQLPNNLGMPNVSQYRVVVDPPSLNGSEFFTGERFLDVTDLLPGTTHEFTVYARSVSGDIVAESGPSETVNATTDTTVPAPLCGTAPTSANGVITVSWSYLHAGGLHLTEVVVDYREDNTPTFVPLEGGSLSDVSLTALQVFNFTAGREYIFQVMATNAEGSKSVTCPPVDHSIGVPQVPERPTGESLHPGAVTLTLKTQAAGVGTPPHSFHFDVIATLLPSNEVSMHEGSFPSYANNETASFFIEVLQAGKQYMFKARARNQFGVSDFSGDSDPILVQNHTFGMFQILLSGVQDCPQWVLLTLNSKLEEVTSIVQTEIEQLCQCGFATRDIAAAAFECSLDPVDQNFVTYRASLQNTQQANATEILSYLEQWVSESEAITVGGLRLRVNSDCPVVVGSFTDPLCTESGNDKRSENTAAIVGGVLGGVVAILAILVGVILIVVLARKLKKSQELDITTKECEAYTMSTTVLGTSTSKISQDTNIAYGAFTSSSQPEEPVNIYEDV